MSDLKKAVFLIGDDKELSAKLQKLLIDKGYAWGLSGKEIIRIGEQDKETCIYCSSDSDHLYHRTLDTYKRNENGQFNNFKFFDCATQFDDVLEFLGLKLEKPNIYFKGRGYKIKL